MVDYKGERLGVMEMRKHIGHYIGGLRGATALRRELNLSKTLEELNGLLQRLLDDTQQGA
jgi:tRNA-dihydrouridine synthase B